MKLIVYDESFNFKPIPQTLAFSGFEDLIDYTIIHEYNKYLNGGTMEYRFQPLAINWWRKKDNSNWRHL